MANHSNLGREVQRGELVDDIAIFVPGVDLVGNDSGAISGLAFPHQLS